MAVAMLLIAGKCALILALGVAALRLLHRASAAMRHSVCMTVFAVVMILPVVALSAPSWNIMPARTFEAIGTSAAAMSVLEHVSVASSGSALLAAAIWGIGALLAMVRVVRGVQLAALLRRTSRPITSVAWQRAIDLARARVVLPRVVPVMESECITVPCVAGLWRPVILVPRHGEQWSAESMYSAVVHELTHVQRRDVLAQLIANVACAIHWYNPLSWRVARGASLAREQACDDAALKHDAVPSEYAELLLALIPFAPSRTAPAMGTVSLTTPSNIGVRVRAILNPATNREPASLSSRAFVSIVGLACALGVGTASITKAQQAVVSPRSERDVIAAAVRQACSQPSPTRSVEGQRREVTFQVSLQNRASSATPSKATRYTVNARCP